MSRSPQKEAAPSYEQLPVQIHVKIYPAKKKGGPLAFASVNLNGALQGAGIKILDSRTVPLFPCPAERLVRNTWITVSLHLRLQAYI